MDLDDVSSLLRREPQTRADKSLTEFRAVVGDAFDPGDPSHAVAARRWLNKWGCRIAYPKNAEIDGFALSLVEWWSRRGGSLPVGELISLTDDEIQALADALHDLSKLPADSRRSIAPTASAKLLFAVRPESVTAWDRAIASRPEAHHDFAAHLKDARRIAQEWVAQANGQSVPELVGRPNSSLAKIVDEALYLSITRGL